MFITRVGSVTVSGSVCPTVRVPPFFRGPRKLCCGTRAGNLHVWNRETGECHSFREQKWENNRNGSRLSLLELNLEGRQVAIKFLIALNKHKTITSRKESVSPLYIWRSDSNLRFTHQYRDPQKHLFWSKMSAKCNT